jgi:hypothetical protein
MHRLTHIKFPIFYPPLPRNTLFCCTNDPHSREYCPKKSSSRPAHRFTAANLGYFLRILRASMFSKPVAPPAHPVSPAPAEPQTPHISWNLQFVGLFVASIRVLTMTPNDVRASWPQPYMVRGPRSEDGATRPSISDLSPSGARNDAPNFPPRYCRSPAP